MANSGLKTYSADEVVVVVGGIPVTEGLGPDTFLSIEYDEDHWSLSVGSAGEGSRAKNNNYSATITITLQQTSDVNTLLTQAYLADTRGVPGGATVPFLCTEVLGDSRYAAQQCWIQKPPTAEYGREVTTREWVLRTHNLVANFGGNQ